MMKYWEDGTRRSGRWRGYVGAYRLDPPFTPFVDVWNRFVDRWNEVELDPNMPLRLHHGAEFAGAHMFDCWNWDKAESIHGPDFLLQIYFRRGWTPWRTQDLCCGKAKATVADVKLVQCHYASPEARNSVWEWMALERARFETNNHYDSVLKFRQAQQAQHEEV